MLNVHLHLINTWNENNGTFVRGTAFLDNKKATGVSLASWASQIQLDDLPKTLKEANGFFSAVCVGETEGWMAVDKIRSFPIFYGQHSGQLFISDDAHWVKEQVRNKEYDPITKAEFLLTGYVTGPDTLYPDVKQVQAGEIVRFRQNSDGSFTLSPSRYYRYIHHDYFENSEEELLSMFDEVLTNTFNRLIDFADGRTIVVPLSGGYDSRLIVLMLKRLGYEKVITYTYGREGNREARISKEVAKALGLQWEFVPYTNEKWYEWYHSEEMNRYRKMADGCCSLPHIQDWPAVKELKESGRIPEDSVFAPGLSADLPAGSRSKELPHLYKTSVFNKRLFLDATLKFHYSLFNWSKHRKDLQPIFEQRILRTLGNCEDFQESASAFESWDIAERQAKYINNSIRAYEHLNYDWWTPFWDSSFLYFWTRIPAQNRINQNFYIHSFNYNKPVKFSSDSNRFVPRRKAKATILIIKYFLKKNLPLPLLDYARDLRRKLSGCKGYNQHPLAWYGMWEEADFRYRLKNGAVNMLSMLAQDHINSLRKEPVAPDKLVPQAFLEAHKTLSRR